MFKRFMASQPDTMKKVVWVDNTQRKNWNNTEAVLAENLQIQLLITGLHNNICKEFVKNPYATLQAVYKAALNLEIIQ